MLSGLLAFIGRVMLALIFIISGAMKLSDISGTGTYMASVGLPSEMALPVAILEVVGGLMIVFGVFTRLTALLFHRETADPMQSAMAFKNIAIAGGFLCLFAYDQKSWSFDSYRTRKRREAEARLVPTSDHAATGAG
jgi:putative oxidoreductase